MAGSSKHPLARDLYTPITPQLLALFERMHDYAGSWRNLYYVCKVRPRYMRRVRGGKRHTMSMRVLDRMITTTGIGDLSDYTWFTADDCVELGLWKRVIGWNEQRAMREAAEEDEDDG